MPIWRPLFYLALASTVLLLLLPGPQILQLKLWVVAWLPWMGALESSGGAQSDKWVHFGLFFILGALATRVWPVHSPRWRGVLGGLLVLGAITEGLQALVPGRGADTLDFCADALGIALGAGAASVALHCIRIYLPKAPCWIKE